MSRLSWLQFVLGQASNPQLVSNEAARMGTVTKLGLPGSSWVSQEVNVREGLVTTVNKVAKGVCPSVRQWPRRGLQSLTNLLSQLCYFLAVCCWPPLHSLCCGVQST